MARVEHRVGIKQPQVPTAQQAEFFELLQNDLPPQDFAVISTVWQHRIPTKRFKDLLPHLRMSIGSVHGSIRSILDWYNKEFNWDMREDIERELGMVVLPDRIDFSDNVRAQLLNDLANKIRQQIVRKEQAQRQQQKFEDAQNSFRVKQEQRAEKKRAAEEKQRIIEYKRIPLDHPQRVADRQDLILKLKDLLPNGVFEAFMHLWLSRNSSAAIAPGEIGAQDNPRDALRTNRLIRFLNSDTIRELHDELKLKLGIVVEVDGISHRSPRLPEQKAYSKERGADRSKTESSGRRRGGGNTTDSIGLYLREIAQYRLLTREDEQRLFTLRDHARDGGDDTQPDPVEVARIEEEIFKCNLRLVVKVAKSQQGKGLDLLDLIQEGNLGLAHAIEKFEISQGNKLSTYAMWWIKQSIQRGIQNKGGVIDIPVHVHEQLRRIQNSMVALAEKLGREPTHEELAVSVGGGISIDKIKELILIMNNTHSPSSLDRKLNETEDADFYHIVPGDQPTVEDVVVGSMESPSSAEILSILDDNERLVLATLYGGEKKRSLQDVATTLNLSPHEVTSLRDRALYRIRINSDRFDDDARGRVTPKKRGELAALLERTSIDVLDQLLPDTIERQILRMLYQELTPIKLVAEQLNISERKVRTVVTNANKVLRDWHAKQTPPVEESES